MDMHFHFTPHLYFYVFFLVLGVLSATGAVAWNRWLAGVFEDREARKQLRRELGIDPHETYKFRR